MYSRCPECEFANPCCERVQDHLEKVHTLISASSRGSGRLVKQEMTLQLFNIGLHGHRDKQKNLESLQRGKILKIPIFKGGESSKTYL